MKTIAQNSHKRIVRMGNPLPNKAYNEQEIYGVQTLYDNGKVKTWNTVVENVTILAAKAEFVK